MSRSASVESGGDRNVASTSRMVRRRLVVDHVVDVDGRPAAPRCRVDQRLSRSAVAKNSVGLSTETVKGGRRADPAGIEPRSSSCALPGRRCVSRSDAALPQRR